MSQVASFLILGVMGFLFFAVPVGGIALFVQMRAKARREMLQGPWTALAQQFGGRLAGESVVVSRDVYALRLDMTLVSVMQCVGSPFYSDGGTYTEAKLLFDPRTEHRVSAAGKPARLTPESLRQLLGNDVLASIPRARVVLTEREARVVMHGAVGDVRTIGAAFAGLEALAHTIRQHGPVPVAS